MIQRQPTPAPDPALLARVQRLLASQLSISVTLAERPVSIEALQIYSLGSLLVLPGVDPERLVLEVEGEAIATGVAVRLTDGHFGIRVDEIIAQRDVLDRLTAALPGPEDP